jgi:hypothetical protein
MSGTDESISNYPPSNPNKSVDKDGYRASFYPGFVSRLAVKDAATGTETELYEQTEIFYLPPGSDNKPWPTSTLQFARPDGRRIVLQIEDPHQQIGRIEIHLKGAGNTARKDLVQRLWGPVQALTSEGLAPAEGEAPVEPGEDPELILICEDGPVLCPPWCPG